MATHCHKDALNHSLAQHPTHKYHFSFCHHDMWWSHSRVSSCHSLFKAFRTFFPWEDWSAFIRMYADQMRNKNLSIYWEPQMYSEVWDISSLHLFFFQFLLHSSLILCLTSSCLDSFHAVTLYGGAINNTLDNQGPRSLLGCRGGFGHKIWRKWVWWCNHLQILKGSVLGHKITLQRSRQHHELKSHSSWLMCLMRDLLVCVSSSENTVRTWNTECSSQLEVKLGMRTPTQCLEWYGGNPSFRIKVEVCSRKRVVYGCWGLKTPSVGVNQPRRYGVLPHGGPMSVYDSFSSGVWVRLTEVDSGKTGQGMWGPRGHGSDFISKDWARWLYPGP